ncbi:MAG TPA: sigma 54-interacting transcriptional regulator [Thermoanaerobaculia bacterium]|nr:sigma 54-interacting transcriptional regulator [Thermoanaerobaculia bacterium]
MRGSSRRTGESLLVSPAETFAWGTATIAVLRHCSLPWYDAAGPPISLSAVPLTAAGDLGTRDRLSLLAQFAAHQAFLQFAGLADGDLDLTEWAVGRRRGSDCRLIRIAARSTDPASAPPSFALIHEFAQLVETSLPVFRLSWARAETVYAEADEIVRRDATADLRWQRRSASGEVLSPGSEVLRELWHGPAVRQTWACSGTIEALTQMASLDNSAALVRIESEFALHRYSALAAVDPSIAGRDDAEAAVAERIAERLAERRHVVAVGPKLDAASRRVVEIASSLGTAVWLCHSAQGDLPATRWFVLGTRMAARQAIDARLAIVADPRPWVEELVASPRYRKYLESGEVPVDDAFSKQQEPHRSYVAALALLGPRIPVETAAAFLREFLFERPLDELCIGGVTRIEDEMFCFDGEAVRAQCAAHIPPTSRMALCRAAARVADAERAGFLLIEAGDVDEGLAVLESLEWDVAEETVARLWSVADVLTPALAASLGRALVACGRYRDAAVVAQRLGTGAQELLLAQCDRRSGDYETALQRLGRVQASTFEGEVLRCELLRLAGRLEEAREALGRAAPATAEERIRVDYERSLLALESGETFDATWSDTDHYLASRFLTYRALEDGDFHSAEDLAAGALALARTPIERVDAWLDIVFATFSAGRWSQTRIVALEALKAIEETQGDRAAAGILFTLTYLAADDGQWRAASSMLHRLRHYYAAVNDAGRLFELKLLDAHLHFSRAEFAEAKRLAMQVLERERLLPQIREAAALIVDEVHAIEGVVEPLRSTGGSGNRELTERHLVAARRRGVTSLRPAMPFHAALDRWRSAPDRAAPPESSNRSEALQLFRAALVAGQHNLADRIARDLGIDRRRAAERGAGQVEVLRAVATAEWPLPADTFDGKPWTYAVRNRLGHWNTNGPASATSTELDQIAASGAAGWLRCGDRELLFVEGCDEWPLPLRDAVTAIVRTRAENDRLRRIVDQEEVPPPRTAGVHGMVGESPAMRGVVDAVARVARRDVALCIRGESGTGKELVARAVHRESGRRHKAFTAVNCAALPENLIESELFGHVRGAYTGADRDRAGLIETTEGGTLFLDEIGEMPVAAQAKLLRFLQDGEFRRVGETSSRSADVRIISATNRPLESAVEEGRFREDLYYRIRGVEIFIPPLRDRGNDVILLSRHFLDEERTKHRGGARLLSPEAESLFRSYRWPGNVRELQNAVRAGHAMAGDANEIGVEHLPERLRHTTPARILAGSYQDAVAKFRRELIEKSLLEAEGNQNRAATLLNMSRQALSYQIRELGILVRKRPERPV